MKLLRDGIANYKSGVALLAVHSAIAFNDAVLITLTGSPHKGENHLAAIKKTRAACGKNKIADIRGVKHLESLLSKKTEYSYRGIVDEDTAKGAANHAERFASWANRNVLKREPLHA